MVVKLPPIRERGDDVDVLAKEFLQRLAPNTANRKWPSAPDALRAIRLYGWPGNIRELQNRVQRALVMADRTAGGCGGSGIDGRPERQGAADAEGSAGAVERALVQGALQRHKGKITSAAVELGISRPTLYELMEELGIEKE